MAVARVLAIGLSVTAILSVFSLPAVSARSSLPSPSSRLVTVPNDELFDGYQWNLRQIRAPEAWDLTTGASSVTIAILDTGVSLTHPDLASKLVPGYDFVNDDPVPDDDHGNGTHVAGIAAAETNNGLGVAGVSWQSRIMPVKVLDGAAQGDAARAALGVFWAVDRGARIVNLGLSGPVPSPQLQEAIEYAYARNVLVIAPVGNAGSSEVSYPAASPRVLAVAATDRGDRRLPTSNTGSFISVAAPGDQIISTFRRIPGGPDGYAIASTTAQAAAQVAGVAALMLAINPALRPDDVTALLEASADDVGPPGRDVETGAGRINAARAVQFAAPWNFFSQGAGSYSAQSAPATMVAFPLIMKESNGWSTSFTVQSGSQTPTSLSVSLYSETGREVLSLTASLPPFGSVTFEPSQISGLPPGFVGGAIARASVPISGVVNEDRAGQDRLSYEGVSGGSRVVWVPLLMREFGGWNTGLQVQNLGDVASLTRVTYYTRDVSAPLAVSELQIEPRASRTLYQPADSRIPSNWVGGARVESVDGQPLAAIVNEINERGPSMSYVGITRTAPAIFAPLIFKNRGGWDTGLQVQNASTVPTTVLVTYSRTNGAGGPWFEENVAPAGGSVTFYQPANAELPDDLVGAALVRSDPGQPLGGVVNEVQYSSGKAMAYDAPATGGFSLLAPLVYREFAGWSSGLQVQNVGSAPTTATVTFYQQDGTIVAVAQDLIDPGTSETYYLLDIATIPRGFAGSAIVASGSHPVAGIVNHVK